MERFSDDRAVNRVSDNRGDRGQTNDTIGSCRSNVDLVRERMEVVQYRQHQRRLDSSSSDFRPPDASCRIYHKKASSGRRSLTPPGFRDMALLRQLRLELIVEQRSAFILILCRNLHSTILACSSSLKSSYLIHHQHPPPPSAQPPPAEQVSSRASAATAAVSLRLPHPWALVC